MDSSERSERTTYLLVDGENIDATLGSSILGRRPGPRSARAGTGVLQFARDGGRRTPVGLFFLAREQRAADVVRAGAAGARASGRSRCPGGLGEKVVDIAHPADARRARRPRRRRPAGQQRRRLRARASRPARRRPPGRRRRRSREFRNLAVRRRCVGRGLEFIDLEYDVAGVHAHGCPASGSSRSTSSTRSTSCELLGRCRDRPAPTRPASSRATGTRNGEQDT